ncbi:MAG: NADPH-dependent F420 reductase [Vicinamibacterales bacterium]
MKIGVLGTGDVGRVLGAACVTLGHDVMIGSRDPNQQKVKDWVAKTGPRASSGTFADAARHAEIAIVATRWDGTENALGLAGAGSLAGKVVIDATNPLDFSSMPPALAVAGTDSGGERIQRWLPAAKVVKAFNIVGNPHMFRPDFPGGPPDMVICGNDAGAKQAVTRLLSEFGWPAIDLGGIESSRYLEALAMIWILEYFNTRSGNHAFKLLRK